MRPIHPGEILKDELDERNLSSDALANELDLSPKFIKDLINGNKRITDDIASRFATFFGTSAQFWINLQISYDSKVSEGRSGKEEDSIKACK